MKEKRTTEARKTRQVQPEHHETQSWNQYLSSRLEFITYSFILSTSGRKQFSLKISQEKFRRKRNIFITLQHSSISYIVYVQPTIESLNPNLNTTLNLNPWPYYPIASMRKKIQKQEWIELPRCCFLIDETPLTNSTQHDFHICDTSLKVTFKPNSWMSSRKNDDTIFTCQITIGAQQTWPAVFQGLNHDNAS